MSRSLKKFPFTLKEKCERWFNRFLEANKKGEFLYFKTYFRNIKIHPVMIGHKVGIHNGKTFVDRVITPDMVGKYLGEFSFTRRLGTHGSKGTR